MKKGYFSLILSLGLILGSYKGYLALYETPNPEPKQIFPCSLDTLPPVDRQALTDGIRVRNREALNELLEDYLS